MKLILLVLVLPGLLLAGSPTAPSSDAEAKVKTVGKSDILAVAAPVIDDVPPKREAPPPPPPPPPDNSLRVGISSPEVLALEQKLLALGYLVGKVDGVFDAATKFGVLAFQKVEGLSRTGKANDTTRARLDVATTPTPAYTSPADHLEVDIPRQVAFAVKGGKVAHIVAVVTGSGKSYYHPKRGREVRAITPNGRYRIYYKKPGLHVSPLGRMYHSSFFNGGIAFHGSPAAGVPYPASHGCVRIPMTFHEWWYNNVTPRNATVYVYGGPEGENPAPFIEEGTPVDEQPQPPPPSTTPTTTTTTTTTVPTTTTPPPKPPVG